jgi:hypothetical protein
MATRRRSTVRRRNPARVTPADAHDLLKAYKEAGGTTLFFRRNFTEEERKAWMSKLGKAWAGTINAFVEHDDTPMAGDVRAQYFITPLEMQERGVSYGEALARVANADKYGLPMGVRADDLREIEKAAYTIATALKQV